MEPQVIDSGNAAMNMIMPQIIGGIVIPVVGLLKKYVAFVGNVIPSEFVQSAFCVGGAFAIAAMFAPSMEPVTIIKFGLESAGTATLIYGGVRIAAKTK